MIEKYRIEKNKKIIDKFLLAMYKNRKKRFFISKYKFLGIEETKKLDMYYEGRVE